LLLEKVKAHIQVDLELETRQQVTMLDSLIPHQSNKILVPQLVKELAHLGLTRHMFPQPKASVQVDLVDSQRGLLPSRDTKSVN
jgi:hypothetical protein